MNLSKKTVSLMITMANFRKSGIICCIAILFCTVKADSQGYSNKGKDFWITYPAHINTTSSAMGIYITSDVAATGMIYVGSKNSIPFTVTPNNVTRKFLGPNGKGDAPNSNVYLFQIDGIASNSAIHVVSDNPVVVYAHIIYSHRSGASLILPSNVWGKQYIVPSYNNIGNSSSGDYGYGTVSVVAKDSNTIIQITPTVNSRSGTRKANQPYQITLVNPGDVYQVESLQDEDISGTKVESISSSSGGCKPIAVFSSTTWSAFGCSGSNSGDNLYQQLFPTGSWGKNFLTSPAAGRAKDIFRMFVKDTATIVKYMENGIVTVFPKSALVNNSFYEYETGNPIYIQADKPISAIQYFKTLKCDGGIIGDPEMISLNPLEQTINNITVFSAHQNWVPTGQSDVTNCYLNIIISTAAKGSFKVNGQLPSGSFIPIPGTSYSYLQEDVSQLSAQNPVQQLSADSNFTAIAYGFGDVESYGYNAGTNIKDFSQYLTIRNPYPTTFNNNTSCDRNPFHIGIVLPYQPLTMVWNFNNNTNISPNNTVTTNVPVADSVFITNGVTQYYYKLPGTYTVNSTNSIPLKVSVNNPSTDGCGGLQDIDYIINITAAPSTDFNVQSTGCIKDSVYFTNTTRDNGTNITQYTWDYNGIKTSSIYNPATAYNNAGKYTVKLSNVNALGCYSDTTKIISISTVPVAAFNQIKPACKNTIVQFADQSTIAAGVLANWYWDFGNGNKDSVNKSTTVSALYDSVRTDTVRLTAVSSSGCKSSTYKVVPVNQIPVAAFVTPEICLNDAFAQFDNQSTIADGTISLMGYAWQFGDQNSSSINNTSNALNGIHKYSAVGNYNITLKAISNNGCVDSVQHSFTVNGSIPNANFSILNQGNLCSNDSLKLLNTSTVDFGNITQLEIYWDYINKPTTKFIDSTPTSNKTYKFLYYNFHQPLSQQFTIHMIAYSGISCISTKDTTITVYASPEISATVSPKLTVCLGDTFTLNGSATGLTASIINNWLWTFGDGNTASTQNYLKLYKDSGTYTIIFKGTTTDGCMDTALNTVTIYPIPHISTYGPLNVLEGNSVTLAPTYGGQPLTYLWTPASYLNNASIAEPLCTPKTDTLYIITATNKYNCSLSDSIYVSVLLMPLIPNVFTPNGDGIHDKWHIEFLNKYPYCIVDVFDRNGQTVFHEYTYSEEWDGTCNGKQVPMGTYYYVIKPNSGREPITGSITIVR